MDRYNRYKNRKSFGFNGLRVSGYRYKTVTEPLHHCYKRYRTLERSENG